MSILTISHLSRSFWKKHVLRDINFSIEDQWVFCFLGKSGCGKTTLLRCTAGLDKRYTGNISIYGKPTSEYFTTKRMGRISQKYSSFPFLTVRENIAEGMGQHIDHKCIEKLLEQFDMAAEGDAYPGQLSWGMNQRVSLMRSLVQDSDIICADEPFGALDVTMRARAQIQFHTAIKENNKTAIVVTHDIDEALLIADTICVFKGDGTWKILVFQNQLSWSHMEENIRYSSKFLEMKQMIEKMI